MSLTVSLIAVLIPLLFMGDIVGRLFREFAVTLAVTILVSAVISLTLTPMMSAKLLRHKPAAERGRFYEASERVFESVIEFYGRTLKWVLRHQTATLLVAVATFVLTILLYVVIPKGFFPVQDTGVILGVSEASQSVSFAAMAEQAAGARPHDPEGSGGREPLLLHRHRRHEHHDQQRPHPDQPEAPRGAPASTSADVIRRLQPELAKIQGITLFMQPVQDLTVEDRVSRTQFQYSLEDADGAELATWVPRLMERLKALPELRDVATDQQNQGLRGADLHRPRRRHRAWASRRRWSTTRCTTPSGSGRSRPCSRS